MDDQKVQLNVLVRASVKKAAQEMIAKYRTIEGQPVSLSDLVDRCLQWYTESEK